MKSPIQLLMWSEVLDALTETEAWAFGYLALAAARILVGNRQRDDEPTLRAIHLDHARQHATNAFLGSRIDDPPDIDGETHEAHVLARLVRAEVARREWR